jgi:transposase
MSQAHTLFIGMDVHKDAIAVASGAQAHGAEVPYLGAMGTRPGDIDQLVRTMPSKAKHLIFIYEAGPCGSWLYRYLMNKGDDCGVVAPALIPQQPGDRVTTDRKDAMPLARLARSGALTVVSVPKVADEAMRDRTHARAEALSDCKDAKLRLTAFLLRHDLRYTGRANGSPAHLRCLSEVGCPSPAQPIVFQEYVRAVSEPNARLQRLAHERHDHVTTWRLYPVVEALQALRGVPCTVAVPLVAAMGDRTRCASPRERMTFLGLIPAEPASGEQRRQGSMTTAGTIQARRGLGAGTWAYRSPAKVSRHRHRRLEKQPPVIQDIRWKAQVRLCTRSRRLVARGKHAHGVTVAMARELTGCRWAMATEVPLAVSDPIASPWPV